uniref:Uncharacterized protein n=1 Tax=uncultured marine virus TaxID=186617 RepID=A0A0F7L6J8_9VIRU|nr:hypothetical protein [uncultured marine virus]
MGILPSRSVARGAAVLADEPVVLDDASLHQRILRELVDVRGVWSARVWHHLARQHLGRARARLALMLAIQASGSSPNAINAQT